MVAPVDKGDADIDHRVAGEDAVGERGLHAGVDRRDVLLGDAAAGDLVDELEAAALTARLDVDLDVGELV